MRVSYRFSLVIRESELDAVFRAAREPVLSADQTPLPSAGTDAIPRTGLQVAAYPAIWASLSRARVAHMCRYVALLLYPWVSFGLGVSVENSPTWPTSSLVNNRVTGDRTVRIGCAPWR